MSITRGHTRISFSVICLFAFLLLLSGLNAVQAVSIWSPSGGTGDGFVWSNGHGSDKNLFGNPTVTPTDTSSAFSFAPTDFIIRSTGRTFSISDSFQFDIEASAGRQIDEIRFAESGSYNIAGTGSVKATCTITIQDLDVYTPTPLIQTFDVFEAVSNSTDNKWSGNFVVDGINWSHIRITVSNKLTARNSSGNGSTSWIQKNNLGVNDDAGVEIVMIPEPATIGILTMGSLAISIFRRKKR